MKTSYCIYNYLTLLGYECEILRGKIKISNTDLIIDMTISQFFHHIHLKYYVGKIYKNFTVTEVIKPVVKNIKIEKLKLESFFRDFDKNWYENYFHSEEMDLGLLYND
jgi:hypothetical protein